MSLLLLCVRSAGLLVTACLLADTARLLVRRWGAPMLRLLAWLVFFSSAVGAAQASGRAPWLALACAALGVACGVTALRMAVRSVA